jgi:hypothetical protein
MPLALTVAREMPSIQDSEGDLRSGRWRGRRGRRGRGAATGRAKRERQCHCGADYTRLHNSHLSELTILSYGTYRHS